MIARFYTAWHKNCLKYHLLLLPLPPSPPPPNLNTTQNRKRVNLILIQGVVTLPTPESLITASPTASSSPGQLGGRKGTGGSEQAFRRWRRR